MQCNHNLGHLFVSPLQLKQPERRDVKATRCPSDKTQPNRLGKSKIPNPNTPERDIQIPPKEKSMAEEGKPDAQLFQLLSNLLQQVLLPYSVHFHHLRKLIWSRVLWFRIFRGLCSSSCDMVFDFDMVPNLGYWNEALRCPFVKFMIECYGYMWFVRIAFSLLLYPAFVVKFDSILCLGLRIMFRACGNQAIICVRHNTLEVMQLVLLL